ncbi:hypothetical protein RRF57_008691 [Xylaria bambusicola]|uniref:Uncharacterized protein n=1 Tax=Xylaria bambusicola TaxID=326684 RepID=A0AAN7Z8I3_9PEZI
MVLGNEAARAAVAIADRAYRNSESDGVRVSDMSIAKSSAAKIRPDRYGDAAQIEERSITARADSIRAISLMGFASADECRSGARCRRASVMKVKSLALFTFGITMASSWGSFAKVVTCGGEIISLIYLMHEIRATYGLREQRTSRRH